MLDLIISETKDKMNKAIEHFETELGKISTGRANPSMLDPVRVDYYGTPTPIDQMASVSIAEGTQIVIKPYDKTTVKDIDAAIRQADLGFNPNDEGDVLRINVPPLTEETRKKAVKVSGEVAENAKVSIRQIRQTANDQIKKDEEATDDMKKGYQEDVQELTNQFNKQIEELRAQKETALMTV
jgi:ribosome recycling factor